MQISTTPPYRYSMGIMDLLFVGLLAVLLLRHLLVFLHLLSGWASLHPGEELLRGS